MLIHKEHWISVACISGHKWSAGLFNPIMFSFYIVSFSLSGMLVNYLGVVKCIDHCKQQHLNISTVWSG